MKADLGKHAALLDPACMAIAGTTASGLVKRTSLAVSDFRLFFSDQFAMMIRLLSLSTSTHK